MTIAWPYFRAGSQVASQLVYPAAAGYRCSMPISVTVPDGVVAALELPPRSLEGLLPVASACRLAGWSRHAFERVLGERKIPAGYTTDDLDQDT